MAFTSSFFNSENGDRLYNAESLAERFALFFTNGVFFDVSRALQVESGNGLQIVINTGACHINGYCGMNASAETIQLEKADAQNPRMDAVTVCLDLEKKSIEPVVFKGTPAQIPSPPYITETNTKKYLCLAYVTVGRETTQLYNADIKDTRLDSALCGVVSQAVQSVDTTTLFEQINSSLIVFMNKSETTFSTWFSAIREQLESVEVGELENRLVTVENEQARQNVYIYRTGQVSDNVKLSEKVNSFLSENKTDMKSLCIMVQGDTFSVGATVTDRTGTYPTAFLRFGIPEVTNRRVIIDFSNCVALESVNGWGIVANSNVTIRGLRFSLSGSTSNDIALHTYGARIEKCIITGRRHAIKGNLIYAEDCKLEATGVNNGICSAVNCGGSLINCDCVAQNTADSGLGVSYGAFGVRVDDVYPLFMIGGSARGYVKSSASSSEGVGLYVASGVDSPVINVLGVRFPQVARSGYTQTNAVKINTGYGSVVGCMSFKENAVYSTLNIHSMGNVVVNKSYGLN